MWCGEASGIAAYRVEQRTRQPKTMATRMTPTKLMKKRTMKVILKRKWKISLNCDGLAGRQHLVGWSLASEDELGGEKKGAVEQKKKKKKKREKKKKKTKETPQSYLVRRRRRRHRAWSLSLCALLDVAVCARSPPSNQGHRRPCHCRCHAKKRRDRRQTRDASAPHDVCRKSMCARDGTCSTRSLEQQRNR